MHDQNERRTGPIVRTTIYRTYCNTRMYCYCTSMHAARFTGPNAKLSRGRHAARFTGPNAYKLSRGRHAAQIKGPNASFITKRLVNTSFYDTHVMNMHPGGLDTKA